MTSMNRVYRTIQLAALAVLGVTFCCYCQTPKELNVLGVPVSENTAVRFFFTPGNYFHGRWPDHEHTSNAECPIHPQFHRG